ncbi:branched-chain amino acid ABC transporter permease [Candidatus Atribacteria bacterium HGW-Atribacteria-1]|nr:MAG: branched-chain amino acid ABC transporter permease [Candidatus Atribacteria bacterium HGW-Atribacteria-1]
MELFKKREFNLFVFILFIIFGVSLRTPSFLYINNFVDILNDTAILSMVAIGQLMIIVTGGIDLSVGSSLALSGMSVALLNQYHPGIPIFMIILISIAIGLLLGSINGLLVSQAKIPPIITTLGTMSIYRGLVFVLCKGTWVSAHEMTEVFRVFPRRSFLGISSLIYLSILTVILFLIFLNLTRTGREIYGVGGNKIASQYVGINLKKIQYIVFTLGGGITGLAGFLWVARYAAAQSETAIGFELQTIAACVIGGVSIMGGSGTIIGVVLGAFFMGIVYNALTMINVSPFWQMAIQGFIILFAIIINTVMDKRNQQLMLRKRSFNE